MAIDYANAIEQGAVEYLDRASDYYRFLARMYYKELDEAIIQDFVATQHVIELDDGFDESERAFALGNNKMVRYLQRRNPDTLTESRCDFARVFLGAGQNRDDPVSPFESVNTSEEQLLMQGARDDVYRILRSEHLVLDDEFNMPEDHISFEFQYLARVGREVVNAATAGEADTARAQLAKYRDFFGSHISNWVPGFCEKAQELARTPFYQGLLQCTSMWVQMESDLWKGLDVAE